MKFREAIICSSERLMVPDHIQRIESKRTYGWQIRYGSKKGAFFADHSNDGSGAEESLAKATAELIRRIKDLPAPTQLRHKILSRKATRLPLGISGPHERIRKGKGFTEFEFRVSIPRFGKGSTNKNVYIGTNNTVSNRRIKAALQTAIRLRQSAEQSYRVAATAAKRAEARRLA